MAKFNRNDLRFVLDQIRIAENNSYTNWTGTSASGGTPIYELIDDPLLTLGLRTVDGTFNNLIPGQENFGAADTVFPRLLPAEWRNEGDDTMVFGGPAVVTNNDYAAVGNTLVPGTGGFVAVGDVADADPRIISNLIADQSNNNPAAIAAWLANPKAIAAYQEAHGGALPPEGYIPTNEELANIPNIATDEGLSASYNSWFTLFGQFFDHGLDLVTKGGNGFVYIPLQPDDPLYVPGGHSNFMVVTRTTPVNGHEALNTTTSWVDQNQTYTSHPSHQAFLREYELDVNGSPIATGKLLEGVNGGLATWADIKLQAQTKLGINLTDYDIDNVPLLATDQYGQLILSVPGGRAQLVTEPTPGNIVLVEGNTAAPVSTEFAKSIGHAFLDDIAHAAVPFYDHDGNPTTAKIQAVADGDSAAGLNDNLGAPITTSGFYDNELLNAHYITGDGRGNENIGLTAVHHVFHSEHNRQTEEIKATILEEAAATNNIAFLNEWLTVDVAAVPAPGAVLSWDGERIFQAARFATEMQYQHLVFEEFARKVQPAVNVFAGIETSQDAAIVAEFAHVVYRFGHSMLTETVDRIDANGNPVLEGTEQIGLIEAFLNPLEFASRESAVDHGVAAAEIIRGMTRQTGNELDEFVTEALRNNLVGLPLDLAAINIARGRETGIPSLNSARRQFFDITNDSRLEEYSSWADFAANLKHPESVINFIAAYGTHSTITSATTLEAKRAAATLLVVGNFDVDGDGDIEVAPVDRVNFMNSTGAWASGSNGITTTGLDAVDFWIGGLAEKQLPFGGLLGSTFGYVFEKQLELLQNSDRLYYLARTAGLNFLTELEGNSFAELIMRNTTGLGHVGGDVFAAMDHILEINQALQIGADPEGEVVRNNPATPGADSNYLEYTGGGHVVLGGTDLDDILIAGIGDDTLWGDGGNDRLEGGAGNDQLIGGDGDDIITDEFGDDNIKGGAGDDVINAGTGVDLIIAGDGNDFVNAGEDDKETFGGEGDDFILGGNGSNTVFADGGNDWLEGEDQADLLQGDNGDPFQVSAIAGHDVVIGGSGNDDYDMESGDDIAVSGDGTERYEGMLGFDWLTHKGDSNTAIDADMLFTGLVPDNIEALRDRMDMVEAMSGWNNNDILRGDNLGSVDLLAIPVGAAANTGQGTFNNALNNVQQIALINGLQGLLDGMLGAGQTGFSAGNILLGGGGSDTIEGRGGNDLIDGDKWLNVQISYVDANNVEHRIDSLSEISAQLFEGTIKPSQLKIVREILSTNNPGDVDTVVYNDIAANYLVNTVVPVPGGSVPANVGSWTVVDNAPLTAGPDNGAFAPPSDEGTDTLRNVERLQFADGDDLDILPDIVFLTNVANVAATGQILINDTSPSQGQLLTATPDNLFDANGMINMATLQFHWEAETAPGIWTRLLTNSPTFTPSNAQANLALRVVATFEDNFGNQETIISAVTDPVINNNDAPNAIDREVVVIEDTTETLTLADFGFSDPDVGDSLTAILIESIPAVGELRLNGVPVTGPFPVSVSAADINNGLLVYAPGLNGNGDAFAQFDFNVQDAFGGTSAVAATVFLNVTPVNDAPVGTDGTVTILEDGQHTFVAANFGFTDVDVNDALSAVRIDSLPANGSLVLGVTPVVAGDTITSTQIANGLLKFVPAPNGNGAGYGTFTFSVLDLLGVPDTNPNTLTLNVTAVNDAPVGVPVLSEASPIANAPFITPTEGQQVTSSMLGVSDVDGLGTLNYQWQEFNSTTSTWVNIVGATAANFTPTQAQVGKSIRVSVSYTDGDGTLETVISAGTEVVGELYNGNNSANNPALTNGEDIANGNGGADILRGLGGIDILNGGAGNDNLDGGNDNDTLDGGVGADILLGGDGDDIIRGGANVGTTIDGNDTLVGGAGADTMTGGDGNDTYEVDNIGDQVIETNAALTQIDTVETTLTSYTLGANVENLNFTDVDPIAFTGTGNALNNRIEGGDGNDILDGGAGRDTMIGGLGNDTYVVDLGPSDAAGDIVTEAAGQGNDTVLSSVTYTIGANIENLTLTGTADIDGTGNTLDNVLTGNSGNNTLNGGTGADTLNGGAGNDTLIGGTGNTIDTINGEAGDDLIQYTVGQGADVVDGGDDNDTLAISGTTGNDTLSVLYDGTRISRVGGGNVFNLETITANLLGGTADLLSYNGPGGTTANVTVNLATGSASGFSSIANIENVTTGSGNDSITGSLGAVVLNTLSGGAGDDSYFVDGGETISEAAAAGTDTVFATLASGVGYTITDADVENLTLLGTTNSNATGNASNNTLTGNTGNNVLSGLGGVDTLLGGDGADDLTGGAANDIVNGEAGNDTIRYLMGDGSDTIDGGADSDTLIVTGTTGNDTLDVIFDGTSITSLEGGTVTGIESIVANLLGQTTADTLSYGATASNVTVNLALGTASGFTSITGIENVTTGAGNDTLIGNIGSNTLNGGTGIDTYDLSAIVNAVNINLTTATGTDIGTDTLTSIENIIGSQGGDFISLNGGNNRIEGRNGNDTINAGGGNDILIGGDGNDTLIGGTGFDTFVFETSGFDSDTITGTLATELFDSVGGVGAQDFLDISGLGITNATFAGSVSIAASGVDTVITIGADQITLVGVNSATVDVTDFILAP